MEAGPFLLDPEDLESVAEDLLKVGFPEEVVVVVPVDEPVPRPPLPRIVLKAGAKGGQVEGAAVLQKRRDMIKVALPIGLFHMVEEAGVDEDVEAFGLEGGKVGVGKDEGKALREFLSLRPLQGLLHGKG